MARPKRPVPPPRRPARSHDEIQRRADWSNPRVVQILDAAARCFARDGLAGTTVQQIAREAGLTKSMIHYYFESKQVLILELQTFVHERYFRKVKEKLAELGPGSERRLQEALWEVYSLIVNDKQFLRLQLELLAEAGRDPTMKHRMDLALRQTRELIAEAAEVAVNEAGDTPIPLPASLPFLIASVLLGLRIQEYLTGDSKLAEGGYQMFVAMLTGAMNTTRQHTDGPSASLPPPPASIPSA